MNERSALGTCHTNQLHGSCGGPHLAKAPHLGQGTHEGSWQPHRATDKHQHKSTETARWHKTACRGTSNVLTSLPSHLGNGSSKPKSQRQLKDQRVWVKNIFPFPTSSVGTICVCSLKNIQEITELMLWGYYSICNSKKKKKKYFNIK